MNVHVAYIFLLFIIFDNVQHARLMANKGNDVVPTTENVKDGNSSGLKKIPELCRLKLKCPSLNDQANLDPNFINMANKGNDVVPTTGNVKDGNSSGLKKIPGLCRLILKCPPLNDQANLDPNFINRTEKLKGVPGEHGKDESKDKPGPKDQRGEKVDKGEQDPKSEVKKENKDQQGTPGPTSSLVNQGENDHGSQPGAKDQPVVPSEPGKDGSKGEEGPKDERGEKVNKGEQDPKSEVKKENKDQQGTPGTTASLVNQGENDHGSQPGAKDQPDVPGEPGKVGSKGEGDIPEPTRTTAVKGEKGPKGDRGEKGDKGEQGAGLIGLRGPEGPKGINGEKGEKGEKGVSGKDGQPGVNGQPGESGKRGETGKPGLPGSNGKQGEKGFKGEMGMKGDKGEQGVGIKGEKGEPAKSPELDEPQYPPGEVQYKSIMRPAKSCHDLNKKKEGENKEDDKYYVNPSDPFEVRCDFTNKEMCLDFNPIPQLEIPKKKIEVNKEKAFWMSEVNFDLYKFYGINFRQLMWFQAQAKSAITQTIRFHCKNIDVRPKDKDNSLQLLSWNQKLIDFEISKDSPIQYTIPPEMDKCKDSAVGDEEFKFTDVTLEGIPYYFPIVDFYIRDVRPSKQYYLFEPRQLCAKF